MQDENKTIAAFFAINMLQAEVLILANMLDYQKHRPESEILLSIIKACHVIASYDQDDPMYEYVEDSICKMSDYIGSEARYSLTIPALSLPSGNLVCATAHKIFVLCERVETEIYGIVGDSVIEFINVLSLFMKVLSYKHSKVALPMPVKG